MLRKFRRAGRSTAALTIGVLAVGLALAVGTGLGLRAAERQNSAQLMDRRTELARVAVAAEARRYIDATRSVAAAVGAQRTLTAHGFAAITAPLVGMRLPGATAVAFVVPVAGAQVPDVQRQWRQLGASELVLRPVGPAHEHAFAVLRRPLDGELKGGTGIDVTQRQEPANALAESRRTFNVAISDSYRLLTDDDLPREQRQLSFMLAAPVYHLAPDGEGQGAFRGWVTMAMRGGEFLGTTLTGASQGYLNASLIAVASDGRQLRVASLDGASQGLGLRRQVTIDVAQQQWVLRTEARRSLLPAGSRWLDTWAFAAIVGLSMLLATLVFAQGSRRHRAEARVAEATAALRAKQEYVGALVDTMDVILVASDDAGRFTLINRHAHELHGFPADAESAEWSEAALSHFYQTDGITPLPPDRLPLQRTLAEGEVHDLEFIVAVPGRPRRWLSAHGRRLHSVDGTSLGVVTAAHDITRLRASEGALRRAHADLASANRDLERSNEELSAFAGLVSHDLKSPLAGVAGYADLLRGLYEDGTMPAEARPYLDRICTGVQRMRTLIDDLLAYATARNAAPDVAALDLNVIFDDVVAAHTDRVRLRSGTEQLCPDVYVAPLPTVDGDPTMIRQLVDNLIGNALKYVAPGRAARVDVTAEHDEHGWVRIVVADRGIGIPEGQHEEIFDSFHRAHRSSPYPGTGLGLAICHRIVARHGGAIGARDNPGGGAQIWFSLPDADRRGPREGPAQPAGAQPPARRRVPTTAS